MSWVKVCGLTNDADVAAAVAAGADALGFVLAASSPRYVDVSRARLLMEDVPALRILVTVDAAPGAMAEMVAATGADGIQPHGNHAAATARRARDAGLLVLRPLGAGEREMADQVPEGQIPLAVSVRLPPHVRCQSR